MSAVAETIRPAKLRLAGIVPPPRPLSAPRLLATAVRNPLEIWPEAVYREPLYRRRFAGRNVWFVCDPELVRQVLVDQADAFEKGEPMRRTLEPALGQGLLTAEGETWRRQRRAASPIFRHERILGFAPRMTEAAARAAERWRALAGGETDVARDMTHATYDIIAATMLGGGGADPARVERAVSDYLDPLGWVIAMSILRAPKWLPYPGRARGERAVSYLREEIGRVVAERRAASNRPDDLLTLLVETSDPETGLGFGDRTLVDNLLTFINAGHETTALALAWTFYLLDRRPEAAELVRAEVARVAGDGPVEGAHVASLVYTRQVIQEAMRLYPPAAALVREAARAVDLGAAVIGRGAQVYVPVYALHRHETLWDEPDAFDPARFAPEAVKARHRYAYLPFGAGPRICIGMSFALIEAAIILATLVREFRPRLKPGFEPTPRLRATLRPSPGLPMAIERI